MGHGLASPQPGAEQPFLECSNNTTQPQAATGEEALQRPRPALKVLPPATEQSLLYFLLFLNEAKLKREKPPGSRGTRACSVVTPLWVGRSPGEFATDDLLMVN